MKRILITGANGQIGSELVGYLRENYEVIASDVNLSNCSEPKEELNVLDKQRLLDICQKHEVDTLIHLAAILSVKAEQNVPLAWDINMQGLINALEVAKELKLQFFSPSSIRGLQLRESTRQHTLPNAHETQHHLRYYQTRR